MPTETHTHPINDLLSNCLKSFCCTTARDRAIASDINAAQIPPPSFVRALVVYTKLCHKRIPGQRSKIECWRINKTAEGRELFPRPCAVASIIHDPLSRTITAESDRLGTERRSFQVVKSSDLYFRSSLVLPRPLCCLWWVIKDSFLFSSRLFLILVLRALSIFHVTSPPVFCVMALMLACTFPLPETAHVFFISSLTRSSVLKFHIALSKALLHSNKVVLI